MDEQSDDPVAALAREIRAVLGKLKRRLRAQSRFGDLTESQATVLLRLERDGPATVSALARAEGMRPQSMGTIIAALEAAGLVSGTPDARDGRQTILSVTTAFQDWIEADRAARQDWLFQAIRTHLDPAEQQDVGRAVQLLRRLVDP